MAKAINWPKEFYEEVMSEDTDSQKIAIRPGSIYYENGYYTDKEIIDVRVNHKIVRKGFIDGDMRLLKIKDISDEDLNKYKSALRDKTNLINFLSDNYKLELNEESEVTLISYKNLDIAIPDDDDDDPHM